jgi:hypothetical protein
MPEIRGNWLEVGATVHFMEDVASHCNKDTRALLRQVQLAEELLARRFDDTLQVQKILRRRIPPVGVRGTSNAFRVRRKVFDQRLEEGPAPRWIERLVEFQSFRRGIAADDSSSFGQQGMTKRQKSPHSSGVAPRERPFRSRGKSQKSCEAHGVYFCSCFGASCFGSGGPVAEPAKTFRPSGSVTCRAAAVCDPSLAKKALNVTVSPTFRSSLLQPAR